MARCRPRAGQGAVAVAAQARSRQIDADRGLVVRLLLVGLPLTVLAGFVGARLVSSE